ncbi:MAG: (d)CMP kinase [Sciscionella sp.]
MVALDGPSGTGKSTVARRLAARLSAGYLDTGSMYRAATLAVLRAATDLDDLPAVTLAAAMAKLQVGVDPGGPSIELNGEDVAAQIRGPAVTAAVSAVSAIAEVRELLVAAQQRIIAQVLVDRGGIVVEGRDIGATVAPGAEVKVYLTASDEVRAHRRARQDSAAGRVDTVANTLADVRRRDALDSTRATSPLRRAPDAVVLDTTDLELAQVIEELVGLVADRGALAGGTG